MKEIRLSVITPYYNTLEYTKRLAERLIPQLTDETEWIIISDGVNDELGDYIDTIKEDKNIRFYILTTNSGGASVPRNTGLSMATGKYIAFVDSDDMVSPDYIEKILTKTKEEWNYCYISWRTKNQKFIIRKEPPSWNCCVWNCIYKRELIGNERFNPELRIAEDYDFNKRVRKGKRANIKDILYIYDMERPNSLCRPNKE